MDAALKKAWTKWALHILGFAITTAIASQLIPANWAPAAAIVEVLLQSSPKAAADTMDGGAP